MMIWAIIFPQLKLPPNKMAQVSGTHISCNKEEFHHGNLHVHLEGDSTSTGSCGQGRARIAASDNGASLK